MDSNLDVEPLDVFTSTSEAHLHARLQLHPSSPTTTMLPSTLTMTFSISWRSSSPSSSIEVFNSFTPQCDGISEQAVEEMLVGAIAPSRYDPRTEDMDVIVRSIRAYGYDALHCFPSPFSRAVHLNAFIVFYDDPPPPPPVVVDLPSLPGEDQEGPLDLVGDDDAPNTELIEAEIENDFTVGAEAAAIRGPEASIHGGGDHVEQTGETRTAATTSTPTSCAISLEEHDVGVEITSTPTFCPICLEVYEVKAEIIEMPCGHRFHGDCLRMWLHRSYTCPLCRYSPLPLQGKGKFTFT